MSNQSNKPFHTYENASYDGGEMCDVDIEDRNEYGLAIPPPPATSTAPATSSAPTVASMSSLDYANTRTTTPQVVNNPNAVRSATMQSNRSANAIESPFADPNLDQASMATTSTNNLVLSSKTPVSNAVNIVTKLMPSGNISQSPMDSIKEWSVSTFKCTKQLVNEKLGKCTKTSDVHLEQEIEKLRENQRKFNVILKTAQQMNTQYSQLVQSQRQLCELMNEMALRYTTGGNPTNTTTTVSLETTNGTKLGPKQSNKVSVSSSSTSSTLPTTLHKTTSSVAGYPSDFAPVLNHIKMTSNTNIGEDFRKNALVLSISAKNGERLIAALTFFCANLSTLINKTIEDTLCTVRAFESARLEYDAERNSVNHLVPTMQTSVAVSNDKLNSVKSRYDQLREDVQIKMRFLDENKLKVMHKQLVLFNSAFAAYASGNTGALEAALKQFSIR